jgi:hypothetical protein
MAPDAVQQVVDNGNERVQVPITSIKATSRKDACAARRHCDATPHGLCRANLD